MITIIKPEEYSRIKKDKSTLNVVTHDGLFHSDDVFSIALLKLFHKDINVVRTRNKETLKNAIKDEKTYVLDAGGIFDPEKLNFDHHAESPEDMATISLLFQHLFPDLKNDRIMTIVYDRLIRGINDWDLGIADRSAYPLYLPQLITAFNRFGTTEQDIQFLKAVEFAYTVLSNEMNTAKEIARSKDIWDKRELLNGNTALLHEHCAFWRTITKNEKDIKYILQPDNDNWQIVSIDSKTNPLPSPGDDDKDVVFRHKNGFIIIFSSFISAFTYINKYLS